MAYRLATSLALLAASLPSVAATGHKKCEDVIWARPMSSGPQETLDPFLFCVYHHDKYPAGNDRMEERLTLRPLTLTRSSLN